MTSNRPSTPPSPDPGEARNNAASWQTKLLHAQRHAPAGFESLAPPTFRGSTVVFPSLADVREGWRAHRDGYAYGTYGTPTSRELALRIADLEHAHETFLVPSGQAAIALVHLAFAAPGAHVLLPANAYGLNQDIAANLLRTLGVHVELYAPDLGSRIADLFRPETVLVWCESPGSITMEVQDVPAIVREAHLRNIPVALDNTYAAGVFFDAFAHGIDISIQALTKFLGGHGDLLLGSVSVASHALAERLGDLHRQLGYVVAPDECSLALRGLQTLGLRLERMERSALTIAQWLAHQPGIAAVLHPALPSCPGHDLWKRDFHGSASLFSLTFQPHVPRSGIVAFVDALRLFKIGWSWGSTLSVVSAYLDLPRAGRPIVRLHIGLEPVEDLIADLDQALRHADLHT